MQSLSLYSDVELAFLIQYGLHVYIPRTREKIHSEAERRSLSKEKIDRIIRRVEHMATKPNACPRCKSKKIAPLSVSAGEDATRTGYITIGAIMDLIPKRGGSVTMVQRKECTVCRLYLSPNANRPISAYRALWQRLFMPLMD
ncbi:MAG TPA: hypothetical protein DCE41_22830 [Cytophagales bacterium]|nr:hypothetical protein [Cytophagales bacterium]